MPWSYERSLNLCARRYVDEGAPWGLSRSQAPSLVNTAEVLFVLVAARRAGDAVPDDALNVAWEWLARSVTAHCSPLRSGGRGEKTRFVAFTIWGLTLEGAALEHDAVLDSLRWCVNWLAESALADGWSEERGSPDASLFQNSIAIRACVSLLKQHAARPARLDDGLVQLARDVVDCGVRGLLYHRLNSGAWPRRCYESVPSPSKTALAILALSDAASIGRVSDDSSVGGASGPAAEVSWPEMQGSTARWLASHSPRWVRFVEADPDVIGTLWTHFAFALCLQALVRLGHDVGDSRLAPAWQFITDSWNDEARSWCEGLPGSPSVRSSVAAVSTFEELRRVHGDDGFDTVRRVVSERKRRTPATELELVRRGLRQFSVLWPLADSEELVLRLTEGQINLIDVLARAYGAPEPAQTNELASALVVAPTSVGTLARRLNRDVNTQTRGRVPHLVVNPRRGAGYVLNVARIVRR